MANRFLTIYHDDSARYNPQCPLLILAVAIQKDILTDRLIAQVKLKNISDDTVEAYQISYVGYGSDNQPITEIESVLFQDLRAYSNQDFGSQNPIFISNDKVEKILVSVTKVIFTKRQPYIGDFVIFRKLSNPILIEDYLNNPELEEIYHTEVGDENASYVPFLEDQVFHCTCGEVSNIDQEICPRCRRNKHDLLNICDSNHLRHILEEKQEQEKRIEDEQEKRQQVQHYESGRSLPTLFKLLIVIVLGVSCIFSLKKSIQNQKNGQDTLVFSIDESYYDDFERAKQYLNEGSYEMALEYYDRCFYRVPSESKEEVLQFGDKLHEAYGKQLMEIGSYKRAIEQFEKMEDYKKADNMIKEAYYQWAKQNEENGEYKAAREHYQKCGAYSDAAIRAKQLKPYIH